MEKQQNLEETLQAFRQGDVSLEEMLTVCRQLPYEDLGFAKLDHHRAVRQGFPEVVFCEGKTVAQVRRIMERLAAKNANILGTRANWEMYEAVREVLPQAAYHEEPRLICLERAALPKDEKRRIAVLSAGTSDIPVAEEAALTAEIMGNRVERIFDVGVAGIHRLLAQQQILQGALASVVGGLVNKPVVAVPTSVGYGANFGGLSALLCMLNSCAAGVAVVNIDNGFGAGRLASMINHMR